MYAYLLNYLADTECLRHLSPQRVRQIQIRRARRMIEYAREHSPFYRDVYRQAGVLDRPIHTAEDIRALPIVDKYMMREQGLDRVLTADKNAPGITFDMTSGSTGEPFPVYIRPHVNFTSHLRVYHAMWRRGYYPHQRLVCPWRYRADEVLDVEKHTILKTVQRRLGLFRRDIIPIFQDAETIVDLVRERRPHVLFSTRSILELMARNLNARKERWHVPLIVSIAETMLPEQRALLGEAFGGRVLDIYGCIEAPTMGSSVDDRGFEVFSNLVYFEYDNVSEEKGELTGELLITNLLNDVMPFIRYRIRDRGRIIAKNDAELSKFIGPVVGRDDDVIVLPNGFRFAYHHSYQMLFTFAECRQYRFVQTPDGAVHLWLVPTDDSEEGRATARQKVLAIWHDKFPDLPLDVVFKSSLPIGRTGKHRAIEKLTDWRDFEPRG
jgi:phenylacetate-coenzyme A ligase PaaK-like adenylate-forming protein